MTTVYDRALGALLGSFVGDAFGAQTEFKREKDVRKAYPDGIWEMDATSCSVGKSGQITDDSEMVIMMILSILEEGGYSQQAVRKSYRRWRDAGPLDIGVTFYGALDGLHSPKSQANGALMRAVPLGIMGSAMSFKKMMHLSDLDCAITHVHPVCRDCNRLFVLALSLAIGKGWDKQAVYDYLVESGPTYVTEKVVIDTLIKAQTELPADIDGPLKGWVLIAFQLAFYTLLHAPSFEQGMVDVIMHAGDADTNAAIYGALAGAFATLETIPKRWYGQVKLSYCMKHLIDPGRKTLLSLSEEWIPPLLELGSKQVFS